ncbi:MAG: hypothetical protein P8141_12045, partial [Gammaproteobacteria bacterium]
MKMIRTTRTGQSNQPLRAKRILICGKGGSGKSTVVCLLAYAARTRGIATLVVDSDESNSALFK